ncbi:UTRA domain-containing protein [Streptomyces sp. VTCC 41912]|uniref:UTRA domain-containing protein n=1 Tax=Streptomyces sp. VTCC 41912 TaxID=3383243 RepID=UPI003896D21B
MTSGDEWISASANYVKSRSGDSREAWGEEAASHAQIGTQKLTHAGEVTPPSAVAESLQVTGEEAVIVRQRVMFADGTPVELTDTYYPARIASGTALAEPRKIKGGAVAYVSKLGFKAARVIEDVTARAATATEAASLQVAASEVVVIIERLTLDGDDQPIQADVMVAPAKLRRLRYEMKVD